jgi:hypothetical protein
MLRPIPYPEIYPPEQEDFHPIAASRTMFVDEIDEAAARTILERIEASDAPMRAVQLRVLSGAMARVPNDATALPPAARAELLHVLQLPDFDRADRIGEFWGQPETRTFRRPPSARCQR